MLNVYHSTHVINHVNHLLSQTSSIPAQNSIVAYTFLEPYIHNNYLISTRCVNPIFYEIDGLGFFPTFHKRYEFHRPILIVVTLSKFSSFLLQNICLKNIINSGHNTLYIDGENFEVSVTHF